MRTLVIGGAGFIGSHLCDALIKRGDEVFCLDNFSLGSEKNILHLQGAAEFHLIREDAANLEQLEKVFAEVKPEYIFHLAANSDIKASANNPEIEHRNTYVTTFHVLHCMRKYNVKKLFFSSTSAVYGDKRGVLLDENTPRLEPISYYGAAKLASESMISAFSYMNDLQTLIFRFPNVIGPRLTHGVIFDFVEKLKKNPAVLEILGDGSQCKPYIYVKDLIDVILLLAFQNEKNFDIYNIGVDGQTSVTSIAEMVCKSMQLENVQYEYTGGEIGWKGDVPNFLYDLSKIQKEGWKAIYTSDEAVQKTLESMQL